MPNENQFTGPGEDTPVQGVVNESQARSKPPRQPVQQSGISEEQLSSFVQQAIEQAKFELKKEISTALNAKANSLREVDPTTATALQGCAISIAEAQSSVMPIGGNDEFNAQTQAQPGDQTQPQKQADSLDDFIYQTVLEVLEDNNWLEETAGEPQEKLAEDLNNTVSDLKKGAMMFMHDYDIDFEDPVTWDLLHDLIIDGTLMSYVD